MKRLALIAALLFLPLAGCVTTEIPPPATQTARGEWYPGRMIAFPNPPTVDAVSLLESCAVRVSEKVFVIKAYDRHDERQTSATEQAFREGATVSGWRSPP